MDAEPLERFDYIEEYVKSRNCCGCGGGWQAASVAKKKGMLRTSGYMILDAIYETLAMYLEDELRPFGGPDGYVQTQICMKATNKKPIVVPFQPLPRMVWFVQTASQDPALKKHLLAVLWSLLPLNLELTVQRNKERPQHFGKQEVFLNPQAQDFWRKLQALKVCKSFQQSHALS